MNTWEFAVVNTVNLIWVCFCWWLLWRRYNQAFYPGLRAPGFNMGLATLTLALFLILGLSGIAVYIVYRRPPARDQIADWYVLGAGLAMMVFVLLVKGMFGSQDRVPEASQESASTAG